MALKSVVQIEVQDAEFQRFSAMFDKYKEGLAATPDAWKAADVAAAAATGAIAAGAEGLHHHVVLINQAATASKAAAAHTVSQAGAWHSMARDARSFAGHVADATKTLLRWGELTGLISGILGGGGLFGIDRLAINAGERRKSALGLGVSPGEESAFKLNYGRLLSSPDQFLSNINTAKTDYTSDQYRALLAAGVKTEGKDTAQIGTETIAAMKKLVDSVPEGGMFAPTMHARGADSLMSMQDLQRLKNTPSDQVAGYRTSYEKDRQTLDLTKGQARAWQDLQVQLKRAGESIENVFITALTPLAPAIGRLSDAFTKVVSDLLHNPHIAEWIDGLANAIKEFGDWIGGEKFKKDVSGFVDYVGDLMKGAGDFTKGVRGIIDGVEQVGNFLGVLWHTIDEAGRSIAKVAHDVIDPIVNWFGNKTPPSGNEPDDPMTRSPFSTEGTHKQVPFFPKLDIEPGTHREIPFWPKWDGGKFSDPSGEFGPPTGSPANYNVPRGIRNNNPLNISYVPGQEGAVGSDGRFGIYGSQEQGIASAERQLLRYQDRGIDTLTKVLNKWAPSSENDTAAYIARVSRDTGIKPDEQIDFRNRQQAAAIIASMARHETGRQLDPDVVNRGVVGGGAAANGVKRTTVDINVNNATGANITSSVAALAV
jgi:hypothetical protein